MALLPTPSDTRLEASIHYGLGRACLESGDLEGATAAFESVIRIEPNHAQAQLWRRKTGAGDVNKQSANPRIEPDG